MKIFEIVFGKVFNNAPQNISKTVTRYDPRFFHPRRKRLLPLADSPFFQLPRPLLLTHALLLSPISPKHIFMHKIDNNYGGQKRPHQHAELLSEYLTQKYQIRLVQIRKNGQAFSLNESTLSYLLPNLRHFCAI